MAQASRPTTITDVIRVLDLLIPAVIDADVDACTVDHLQELADAVADGRHALDSLATRVGAGSIPSDRSGWSERSRSGCPPSPTREA